MTFVVPLVKASESNPRESLTSQQRNLLLAQPIARLSLDRGVIFKDDPTIADRLDVQYLALSAIDFVMERSAVEAGASPDEIVEHVAAEATSVKPSLTDEQSRKVGQVVLDYLGNARDGHKAFRIEYYDADRGGHSFHDFRLLALSVAADGTAKFKLARGAQILTLAMLDVAPEFAQEAEAIMIRKAVERGRFKDARTLAQRARMRSIHYQQFIEDRLFQVRRAADRIIWSVEVLPELDDARTHLSERRRHEVAIIESIREHIAHAHGDTRYHLVDLKNTIDECRQRHAALFERVMSASEEFRQIQVNAFRARRTQNVPDLEERILVPLLASPMRAVSDMSDEVGIAFAAPTPPRLFDLALLFKSITQPRFRRDPIGEHDEHDLVAIERVPPEFEADEIGEAQEWLVLPVPHIFSLDFTVPLRYGARHGGSESSRTQLARRSCPTSRCAQPCDIAGGHEPGPARRSRV